MDGLGCLASGLMKADMARTRRNVHEVLDIP